MSKLHLLYITTTLVLVTACNPLSSSNTTFTPLSASQETIAGTAKVSLSWGASSGLPSGYQVEQSTDNVTFKQVQQLGLVTTTTVTGLKSATTYYFRVRAYNQGGESPYTATAIITTGN